MLSRHHNFILDQGHNVTLQCDFHAPYFNLFDNPVIWKKNQFGEESDINIMGNIKQPFRSSGRFASQFVERPPRYQFELTIKRKEKIKATFPDSNTSLYKLKSTSGDPEAV